MSENIEQIGSRASSRRTGPFGPAGEILPTNQALECLHPDDSLLTALERLCDAGFNQAPVKDAMGCLGVLRFFQVMQQLLELQWFRDKLQNMPVRNHLDMSPRYIGVNEWVDVGFDWQGDDLALVGSPGELRGMLTATDILRRLTDYAQAFVHLEAIELDTRALLSIRIPLPDDKELVTQALTHETMSLPRSLDSYDHFEFGHYSLMFGREATFARLGDACVWNGPKLSERYSKVGKLRNTLLHFRGRASTRDISELEQLAAQTARSLSRAQSSIMRDG
jgi:CBS domain-containing protein